MPSTPETGHAKNVANLQSLITYLQSLDGKYNPPKATLKLDSLTALYTSASKTLDDYAAVKPVYSAAVDAQEAAFKPLDKLVTRVVNAYKASVDDMASADTIMGIKRKMVGAKSKKAAPASTADTTPAPRARSTSNRSYDQRLENFSNIIKVLEATPAYQPAEDELTIASLKALQAELLQKTQAVDAAAAPVVNARISRDKTLYQPKSGICDVATGVKDYVSSVYGSGSAQLKYVNQLRFKKYLPQ